MHVTRTTEYVGISHPYGALLPQALTQTLHISTTTRCFKDDAYLTFHKRKKLPTDIHSFFGTQYHKILSRSHLQCVELIRKSYFLKGWSWISQAGQMNVTNRHSRVNKTAPTGDTVTMATVVITASMIVIATCADPTVFYNTHLTTLRAKLSSALLSVLSVCNGRAVFVCGSVTMITRNCMHRSSQNWVCM